MRIFRLAAISGAYAAARFRFRRLAVMSGASEAAAVSPRISGRQPERPPSLLGTRLDPERAVECAALRTDQRWRILGCLPDVDEVLDARDGEKFAGHVIPGSETTSWWCRTAAATCSGTP